MIGTKLYPRKSKTYSFLLLYGILAVAGGVLAAQSIERTGSLGNTAGFMIVFGAGMCILTFVKSRKPQVSVFEDFLELRQSRMPELVRYRNIVSVSRQDKKRLVIILRENKERKEATIWLRDLDDTNIDQLTKFLINKEWKAH